MENISTRGANTNSDWCGLLPEVKQGAIHENIALQCYKLSGAAQSTFNGDKYASACY